MHKHCRKDTRLVCVTHMQFWSLLALHNILTGNTPSWWTLGVGLVLPGFCEATAFWVLLGHCGADSVLFLYIVKRFPIQAWLWLLWDTCSHAFGAKLRTFLKLLLLLLLPLLLWCYFPSPPLPSDQHISVFCDKTYRYSDAFGLICQPWWDHNRLYYILDDSVELCQACCQHI